MPTIHLREIDQTFAGIVQILLDSIPSYYLLIEGIPHAGSAKSVLDDLPPGRTKKDKRVLLIEEDEVPVGVIDLIIGYPKDRIAFIGLFALDEKQQGRGLGKTSYLALENYISALDVDSIELGVNDTNHPGMTFWGKRGFEKNGRTKVHEGKHVVSTVIVLEKFLRQR